MTAEQGEVSISSNDLEIKLRLNSIFNDYPFLFPIFNMMLETQGEYQDWVGMIQDMWQMEQTDHFQQMIEQDPDFLTKFEFLIVLAIVDNQYISNSLKQALFNLVYEENPQQT